MIALRHRLVPLALMLLTGCQFALAAEPTPTATLTPTVTAPPATPTPDSAAIAREIEATWQEINSLARPHLAEGLECEACHPNDVLVGERPSNDLCLDCHEGSISALYDLLDENDQSVHPAAHLETERCTVCHQGHRFVADPCGGCH